MELIKIFNPKRVVEEQNYENYWSITLEYSDFFGPNFYMCLNIIVRFIDKLPSDNTSYNYKLLQNELNTVFPKSDQGSTRKSINQFVKLGFIYPKFKGYPKETKKFLNAIDINEKKILFSEIVYKKSNLNGSITKDFMPGNEINFLVKTLQEVKVISKTDLSALMTVNVAGILKGFYTRYEIDRQVNYVNLIEFVKRKYNQLDFMWKILSNLEGIEIIGNFACLTEDSEMVLDDISEIKTRDPYLQKLYKNKLILESQNIFGCIACMVTGMPYRGLIASHIKPFKDSFIDEEYNPDNGLLLSRDVDQLFDSGEITFDFEGRIIFSRRLEERDSRNGSQIIQWLNNYTLRHEFLNDNRKQFLKYHHNHVFLNR